MNENTKICSKEGLPKENHLDERNEVKQDTKVELQRKCVYLYMLRETCYKHIELG